jgi:hypothetical protein
MKFCTLDSQDRLVLSSTGDKEEKKNEHEVARAECNRMLQYSIINCSNILNHHVADIS